MSQSLFPTQKVLDLVDANFQDSIERLFSLLRFPSISTDSRFADDCTRCADALVSDLKEIGFDAHKYDTRGHPIVVGHFKNGRTGSPHAIFYGHYDVQPPDPISFWESDPFDPIIVTRSDGTQFIRARGVSDDKAQVSTFLEACRAWMQATGTLPCNITILLEGEEESGSPNMIPFLEQHADMLRADVALICDTHMWDRDTPAITIALRGMSAGEVTIKAASIDLHSGLFGGPARNPIEVLSKILADLRDEAGRVSLPGFYDDVPELPAELRMMWAEIPFDGNRFLGAVGLQRPAGEEGRSVLEQIWSRPTAEINGIVGGYTGEGFKTVIPSAATAKVSFRLVGNQDPEKVWASLECFVTERLPSDCEATFLPRSGSLASILDINNPYLRAASAALDSEWPRGTMLVGGGGSIPMPILIKRYLGIDSIMPGFGLEDDALHSPNEKYEVRSFHKGQRSWVRILENISQVKIDSTCQ